MAEDDIVLFKLTRCSAAIQQVLLNATCLDGFRKRVESAGCEVQPQWSSSALLFVPCMSLADLEADLECTRLQPYNILACRRDRVLIKTALAEVPHKFRPRLKTCGHDDSIAEHASAAKQDISDDEYPLDVDLVVERTMLNLRPSFVSPGSVQYNLDHSFACMVLVLTN